MENIKTKQNIKEIFYWICVAISLVLLCVMLWLCFNDAIWCDEVFSLNMSKNSYLMNIYHTAMDVHPPVYYLILRFFMDTFTAAFYMVSPVHLIKLVTWIGLAIIFYFSVFKLSKEFPKTVVGLFLVVLFSMNCVGDISIFARMYSFAALFVLVELYFAVKVIRYGGKQNWVGLVVFFELAAYTHNFALVASVGILFYMLLYYIKHDRSKIKTLYICGLVCITLYLPWFFVLMVQVVSVNSGYWIEPITFQTILDFFKYIFLPGALSELSVTAQNVIIIIFVAYHFVLAIMVAFDRRRVTSFKNAKFARGGVLAGLCTMSFMVFAGVLMSVLMTPIIASRYLSIVYPVSILSILMLHYYVLSEYIIPKIQTLLSKKKHNAKRVTCILSSCGMGLCLVLFTLLSALNVSNIYRQEQNFQNVYDEETKLVQTYHDYAYVFDENGCDQVYYYTYHMEAYVIKGGVRWTSWDRVAGEEQRPGIDFADIENMLAEGKKLSI